MLKNKVIAIHQPNFFPWLGYFDKIVRSDIFIFLDDVQFVKSCGTWSNRVKFLINSESKWVTAPIKRNFKGTKNINNMEFISHLNWRSKILKTIKFNYKNHPFYNEAINLFEEIIMFENNNISEFKFNIIITISELIGLDKSKFLKSSDFKINKNSNELLIELVKKTNGDYYLSGGGDGTYLDKKLFDEANLKIIKQDFAHPLYEQYKMSTFQEGLSIFDSFFNIGFKATRELLIN